LSTRFSSAGASRGMRGPNAASREHDGVRRKFGPAWVDRSGSWASNASDRAADRGGFLEMLALWNKPSSEQAAISSGVAQPLADFGLGGTRFTQRWKGPECRSLIEGARPARARLGATACLWPKAERCVEGWSRARAKPLMGRSSAKRSEGNHAVDLRQNDEKRLPNGKKNSQLFALATRSGPRAAKISKARSARHVAGARYAPRPGKGAALDHVLARPAGWPGPDARG